MTDRFEKGGKSADRDEGGRFRPGHGQPGPGRPTGLRNRASRAADALLDGEAEALTRKAVELALGGDTTALRLCLERICPPRKERPVMVELPAVESAQDAVAALAAILRLVAAGEITPSEGQALAGLVELQRKAIETEEMERRIAALEAAAQGSGNAGGRHGRRA